MQVITTKNAPADSYLWLEFVKINHVDDCVLIDDCENKNLLFKNYFHYITRN